MCSINYQRSQYHKLKVLEVPGQLLGVKIKWGENFSTVHIWMKTLIVAWFADNGMLISEPVPTPMISGQRFFKTDSPDPKQTK
jgi:hypothetical protein